MQKKIKTFQKNVSIPRMDGKKIQTLEFQQIHEMQVASKKGLLEKQQNVPNTWNISPLKKIFFRT